MITEIPAQKVNSNSPLLEKKNSPKQNLEGLRLKKLSANRNSASKD